MTKQKYLVLVLMIATLAGSGFVAWKYFDKPDKPKRESSTQEAEPDSTPSSLSVTGGTSALDLGQIPLDGVEGSKKSSGSGSSSTSAAASELDPKTFSQYEKYKDGTSALFGEITKGNGAEPAVNKKAVIVYKGWLTDGTLFDSSPKDADGKYQALAFTFGGNEVIPGLEQGISGMKVGGTRLVIVPPAVGYKDKGYNGVPPNSVMVFQIALVDVQ